MALRKTAIRIDTEAAERAASQLGTSTLTDTVNEALRRFAQIRAAEEIGLLIAEGALDRAAITRADHEELTEASGGEQPRP